MSEVQVLGVPVEYYYPGFAVLMFILLIVFVPKEKFKSYFWLALIWGCLGSIFVGTIFGDILKLFRWEYAMPFLFYGHPIWINLAWLLEFVFFLHYLPTQKEWYYGATYIIGFAIVSAFLDKIFNQIGMLHYNHWNPWYRFFVALAWFYGAAYHCNYLKARGKLG